MNRRGVDTRQHLHYYWSMSQVFSIRRVKHIGAPVYLGDINAALNIEADGLRGWTGPAARGGKTSGVEDLLAHPDDLRTPALR